MSSNNIYIRKAIQEDLDAVMQIIKSCTKDMISKKIYMVTCPSEQTRKDLLKTGIFLKKNLKILYDPIIDVNRINKSIIIGWCLFTFYNIPCDIIHILSLAYMKSRPFISFFI